jgi:virulence-associated protein VagC
MNQTAKVTDTGNGQVVRLPKAFRIEADEVLVSRNETTGEIVLTPISCDSPSQRQSRREREIRELLGMLAEVDEREDFVPPREPM